MPVLDLVGEFRCTQKEKISNATEPMAVPKEGPLQCVGRDGEDRESTVGSGGQSVSDRAGSSSPVDLHLAEVGLEHQLSSRL